MALLDYLAYSFFACVIIFLVPGPLFFLSVSEGALGIRRGFMVLLGTLAGEAILLALLFIGFIFLLRVYITPLKLLGALVLIWLGVSAIGRGLKKLEKTNTQGSSKETAVKGFTLTFANPPFIIWLISVGASVLDFGVRSVGDAAYGIFTFSMLSSTIAITTSLILASYVSRRMLGGRFLAALSIFSGLAFLTFSALLLRDLMSTML